MGKKHYDKADAMVLAVLQEAVEKYHPELKGAHVRIGVVMARDDDGGPAIVRHGAVCAATIKKVSRKDRVTTPFDAIMLIDATRWEELPERSRLALIDHELTHIVVDVEASEIDGRAKFEMQPDDWQLTGFAGVVERHGDFALEKMALRKLHEKHGQMLFDFSRPTKARVA